MMQTKTGLFLCSLLILVVLAACDPDTPARKTASEKLAKELIFYSWVGDLPQSVLDDFTAEYGVKVLYHTYKASQEGIDNLRAGKVCDVMVVENPYVPELAAEQLLAEIDYRNVPNFKHISPSFRDLVYDPGNRYSLTFNWGLIGLLVRSDLTTQPVNRWADLWDHHFKGRTVVWELKQDLVAITLKSLGYSINSENPDELEEALQRLLTLKNNEYVSGYTPELAEQLMKDGKTTLTFGWGADFLRMRASNIEVRYVIPSEGSIQWGDNFVVPRSSQQKYTAEVFINFLMRPEVNARIVNEQYYATANASAYPFIKPEILNNSAIFPSLEDVKKAEVYLPLSKEGLVLRQRLWQRFLAGVKNEAKEEL